MLKKGLIYFVLFLCLSGLNFFLVIKTYGVFDKQTQIEKILSAIAEEKNKPNEGYRAEATVVDGRVANLKSFFRKYNSPLYNNAEKIVEVSDLHQFDYRLLPAIAMQESNLCRVIPDDSHNCWGWGIYGTTVTRFESYDEAIETVGRGIKREYIDKGLVTATAIMEKYTPSSKGSWAHGVNTFLKALE
ncbi:MAG: hypothetical protein US40_C0006G0041 [Candidatus Roizmanbacteria bacterium GW2011_GWC2_37_13]|uniref:Mannosyl-glycoprotein endo-beta-N-acetylglucosamidase-like domain-containing protein n=1 Tax=Candidatus Roizmanbacteria bacterium GW2011_GWC2_37_13 TaxID=1618486 RepID=A0A0G0INH3_9BACT|nr:MAG: hypothetical protein US38_C0010G0044 [Candidatus Roizmanbacteria bacterium GW2011_GWC1_37_12]KKQ25724.1 MAG: hypothetical protein US40_C0006G0041 [Candidatus Roizmanbacteria bacterium GW2011_GWC2_37_13]